MSSLCHVAWPWYMCTVIGRHAKDLNDVVLFKAAFHPTRDELFFRHARRSAAGDGPSYGDTQCQSAAVTRM